MQGQIGINDESISLTVNTVYYYCEYGLLSQ